MSKDNLEYFRQRVLAERAMAEAADNDTIAAIHEEMARRYQELADREEQRFAPARLTA